MVTVIAAIINDNIEITKPAIANPFGCLEMPMDENTIPKILNTILIPGEMKVQTIATKDITKPVVPLAFRFVKPSIVSLFKIKAK